MSMRPATPIPIVRRLLDEAVQPAEWTIAPPPHGQQKECYIASSRNQTVFVKFDTARATILQRLSDLSVAPRLLVSGQLTGRPYVIQEYLAGTHPYGWRWFPANLGLLAKLTQRYQTDPVLAQLLAADTPTLGYHDHIAGDLLELEQQFAELALDRSLAANLMSALTELKLQAQRLQPVRLVPVHGDPNGLNLILVDDQLFLVDWDEIRLSDPVREIGQWLCWYVAQDQWPSFFTQYGCALNQSLIDRLYWWSARASFANAIWHLSRQYPYEVFVRDCWDALWQQMVPHQVFAGT